MTCAQDQIYPRSVRKLKLETARFFYPIEKRSELRASWPGKLPILKNYPEIIQQGRTTILGPLKLRKQVLL